jgi:hypothetical protein
MSSRSLEPAATLAALLIASVLTSCAGGARTQTPSPTPQPTPQQVRHVRPPGVLRVCADPNNLPFSNRRLEGFENKIAELVAREMNATVEYTWRAQRRGFIRETLRAGACDVIIGMPSSLELALTTAPYYRSTYAFVYRKDKGLDVRSFDDPALRGVRIGVQMIGDDFANTPPAHALSSRHIIGNVKGYSVYGDYAQENPRPELSRRSRGAKLTWPSLGGRSRATSRRGSACRSKSYPSRRR